MTDKIVVLTTCGSEEEAERVASALVGRSVAACVAVTPRVRSVYRWKGQVERAEEWALAVKTRAALYAQVEAVIREVHSYEVPEILAVPVAAGLGAYLDWVDSETEGVASGPDDVIG